MQGRPQNPSDAQQTSTRDHRWAQPPLRSHDWALGLGLACGRQGSVHRHLQDLVNSPFHEVDCDGTESARQLDVLTDSFRAMKAAVIDDEHAIHVQPRAVVGGCAETVRSGTDSNGADGSQGEIVLGYAREGLGKVQIAEVRERDCGTAERLTGRGAPGEILEAVARSGNVDRHIPP
jgi:hypothetical protein